MTHLVHFLSFIAVLILPMVCAAAVLLPHLRFRGVCEWLATSAVVGITLEGSLAYLISLAFKRLFWGSLILPFLPMVVLAGLNVWKYRKDIGEFLQSR